MEKPVEIVENPELSTGIPRCPQIGEARGEKDNSIFLHKRGKRGLRFCQPGRGGEILKNREQKLRNGDEMGLAILSEAGDTEKLCENRQNASAAPCPGGSMEKIRSSEEKN